MFRQHQLSRCPKKEYRVVLVSFLYFKNMLSFKHEVFFEVARLKSFTKASQSLYISQPAISKNIKQLEHEYKSSLFESRGNTITLTSIGEMLYGALMKAKEIEKQLQYDVSTQGDQYMAKGELKLGASTTVALYIIHPVLSGFHLKHPNVSISLFTGTLKVS